MIDWDTIVVGPVTGIFGEPVRYRTVGGVAAPITGVFDEPNADEFDITNLTSGAVVNLLPVLGVQLSQLAAVGIVPLQGDVLTRASNGRCYQVAKVWEDSHGAARLDLNNAPSSVSPP